MLSAAWRRKSVVLNLCKFPNLSIRCSISHKTTICPMYPRWNALEIHKNSTVSILFKLSPVKASKVSAVLLVAQNRALFLFPCDLKFNFYFVRVPTFQVNYVSHRENFWESKRNACFITITGEWNKALWSWRTLCCLRVHKIRISILFSNKLSTGLALSKSLHSLSIRIFHFLF